MKPENIYSLSSDLALAHYLADSETEFALSYFKTKY